MTCQRPGCSNDAAARVNNMGPTPRFCLDPECMRIRHIEAVRLYQKRVDGKAPKFKRKGPKKVKRHGPASKYLAASDGGKVSESLNTPTTTDRGAPRKIRLDKANKPSGIESRTEKSGVYDRSPAHADKKMCAEGTPSDSKKEGRAIGKDAPRPDGKVALLDRNAPFIDIDRGTKDGFRRYMEERPVYFRWVFGRVTIAEAWGSVGGR